MSKVRRQFYRSARVLGDVEAASRGPAPLVRRLVRRAAYRRTNRWLGRLLSASGLGR